MASTLVQVPTRGAHHIPGLDGDLLLMIDVRLLRWDWVGMDGTEKCEAVSPWTRLVHIYGGGRSGEIYFPRSFVLFCVAHTLLVALFFIASCLSFYL